MVRIGLSEALAAIEPAVRWEVKASPEVAPLPEILTIPPPPNGCNVPKRCAFLPSQTLNEYQNCCRCRPASDALYLGGRNPNFVWCCLHLSVSK